MGLHDDVSTAIAERSRLFQEAYAANDPKRLVESYFVEDADQPTAYPPGGSAPVKGREALIGMFSGMIPAMPGIRLELIDLITSDSVAHEIGRAFLTKADGTQVIGRYTIGWMKTAEGWRVKADFFAEDGWSD